jgi:hypothetical protein
MPVSEKHQATGSWSLRLADTLPERIRADLLETGHLVVTDSPVEGDIAAHGDQILDVARYMGVCLDVGGEDDTPELEGAGLAWWLGDTQDGKGPVLVDPVTLTGATFAQAVRALLPVAVAEGTLHAVAGTYSGSHRWQTARQAIDYVCGLFDAAWRVRPATVGTVVLDAGTTDQLHGTPSVVAARDVDGRELSGYRSQPAAKLARRRDVRDLTTRVVLLAEGQGDAVVTGEAASAVDLGFRDPQGNPLEVTRLVSESETVSGNATARAQLQLNRFVNPRHAVALTLDRFDVDGELAPGGTVLVYDPTLGLVDDANEVHVQGRTVWPAALTVHGISWPVTDGMGVYFRTPTGGWLDLTDHVRFESGTAELEVGAAARRLTDTREPVSVRVQDPNDGQAPATPTGLAVVGQSNYVDTEGKTRTRTTLGWGVPILNADGSTVTDGDRVELRYALTGETSWQVAVAPWGSSEATVVGLDPGVVYDVQIRAVDSWGNASAWSATVTFTAQPDTIPPSQPAAPATVAGSPLRVQVAHTLGKATGGTHNLESDLDHLEVHVGSLSTFTPDSTTLVGALTANAGMMALAIDAVGTFDAPGGQQRWVKVVAVDRAGNRSAASAAATVTAELVDTAHIADAAISTAKIGDAQITSAKIADLAATSAKIADAAITTAKIADAAITTAKIADAAITNAKIGTAAITTAKIADATITSAKISDLSADKITAGTISGVEFRTSLTNSVRIVIGEAGSNDRIHWQTSGGGAAGAIISNSSGQLQLNGPGYIRLLGGNPSGFGNTGLLVQETTLSFRGDEVLDAGNHSHATSTTTGPSSASSTGSNNGNTGNADYFTTTNVHNTDLGLADGEAGSGHRHGLDNHRHTLGSHTHSMSHTHSVTI